jgi:dihydrofolate synthase / folylpolyglutamate synthase
VTYDEAITYLYGLELARGWDLKLERVRAALARRGAPERRYPSLLIAGTNGKGSTAAIVHSVLQEAGLRVGLYTSPHLAHFTERVRIGAAELSPERVATGVARLKSAVEEAGIPLTFFEMTTVLALEEFAFEEVDIAVLEVGLGGRLDATNVVSPAASAIVSIGYDHQAFLGDTLDAIAREKAGVMRAGRSVVLGPELPPEAHAALLDEATRTGARVVEAATSAFDTAPLALRGEHMQRNAAVALALLDELGRAHPRLQADAPAVRRGLAGVRWPGRLEVVHERPLVVVDGAHNREGMAALIRALPLVLGGRRPRLLFAALADKPWREMASDLLPHISSATVTEVGSRRVVPAADLRTAFEGRCAVAADVDPVRALATMLAESREEPILVSGSLFLVGAVYGALMDRYRLGSVFEPVPGVAA